uniref:Uncharacterized protein n=1 Tax=Arundo donax TaxID=35708 RepID=A0A0A8YHP8_ARUDO
MHTRNEEINSVYEGFIPRTWEACVDTKIWQGPLKRADTLMGKM